MWVKQYTDVDEAKASGLDVVREGMTYFYIGEEDDGITDTDYTFTDFENVDFEVLSNEEARAFGRQVEDEFLAGNSNMTKAESDAMLAIFQKTINYLALGAIQRAHEELSSIDAFPGFEQPIKDYFLNKMQIFINEKMV